MRLQNESAQLTTSQADRSSLDSLAGGTASDTGQNHLTRAQGIAQDEASDFLSQFPSLRRSLIANQFCHAVRGGCHSVDSILRWVREDTYRRLRHRNTDLEVREAQHLLLATLNTLEAEAFARFILGREQLPATERERLKAKRAGEHQRAWMSGQPPTEKQIAYLRKLGCRIAPRNRAEASDLIEQALKGRRQPSPSLAAIPQGNLFGRGEAR